ncbi:hypothetical protein AB0K60_11070 [Thermopolyspora sp. NPDC052614]|uniref:hypothetical protein n=1 Tax=Thermopolyspora sp. NPDC052614 TaxID=3155682 RepID=UPI00342D1FCD
MTSNIAAQGLDTRRLGTLRRMSRLADPGGFLLVAAIDHPENYLALFDADISRVPHETVVASKLELVAMMARHASALLLDPVWSLGQAVLTGDLPGSAGLIAPIERLVYAPGTRLGWELDVRPRPGWGVEKIAAVGADGAKFLVFHRAELTEVAAAQRELVAELAAACHAHGLPLIVEPLWYPLDGEDPADERVARAREEAIVAAAATFADAGADVLKVQFPGRIGTAGDRASAHAAARDLDAALRVPWVLLSEGAGYDDFVVQMDICARAGASGYIAGRAVWGDAVGRLPDAERRAAVIRAGQRLAALNDIVRAHGRPAIERLPTAQATAALPPKWYENSRYG